MKSFALALVATLASLASAKPVRRAAAGDGGCLVELASSLDSPSDASNVITVGILGHFYQTAPSFIPITSSNVNVTNLTASTFTVGITPNTTQGVDGTAVGDTVLKWSGRFIFSNTTSPSPSSAGDYVVTDVACLE